MTAASSGDPSAQSAEETAGPAVVTGTIAVIGVGATGARTARQLANSSDVSSVVLGGPGPRPENLASALGDHVTAIDAWPESGDSAPSTAWLDGLFDRGLTGVVLAGPTGSHAGVAAAAVRAGLHVVSTSDAISDVAQLLELGDAARAEGVSVVAGAAFAPGLSCVLARHVGGWLDHVDEIHIARFGTGGPSCARAHHVALGNPATDWRDGAMVRRSRGSGRELCAFPAPVGSLDCYRAALADTHLLHQAFPEAERITARQAANRRQRLTAWLPMLRKPHPEGRIGAIRVEVRGRRGGDHVTEVTGAIDRPAVAAGAVAGLAARWAATGRLPAGASGLATALATAAVDPHRSTIDFLDDLSTLGVRAAVFEGQR